MKMNKRLRGDEQDSAMNLQHFKSIMSEELNVNIKMPRVTVRKDCGASDDKQAVIELAQIPVVTLLVSEPS